MRHLSFILVLLGISLISFSQQFNWATTGGYNTTPTEAVRGARDIAEDSFGNIYTITSASATQRCQGVLINPVSTGTNIFLHKFNSSGQLSYIKAIGGNVSPLNIEADETGDIYILLNTTGTSTSIVYNGVTFPALSNRNYILKIDLGGNLQWIHDTGFTQVAGMGMLQYANGSVYFQSANLTIAKMDLDANIVSTLSPTYYQTFILNRISLRGSAVFPNGDLLFAANSFGDISFGGDTLIGENVGFDSNPYLYIRTDQDLNVIYATYLQGMQSPVEGKIPVCIDDQEEVFTAVQASATTQIGSDVISGTVGNYANAIVKLNASGVPVWARTSTSPASTDFWAITNTHDNSGVLFSGTYSFSAQFGAQTITNTNSTNFIVKLNSAGDFLYAKEIITSAGSRTSSLLNSGQNYLIAGLLSNSSFPPLFSCIPNAQNNGFFLGNFSDVPGTAGDCTGTIPGCTNPTACNFSAAATVDNGSCTFPRYFIPSVLNGGPVILSCDNPAPGYELALNQNCIAAIVVNDPFCINTNWDGLCFSAYSECSLGCTDNEACNFDPGALTDDGSCSYPGCNNPAACNFDPAALCNDGSCIVPPAPTISEFSPQQLTCTGDFVLTILGTDFCGLIDVLIDGQSCTINSSTDTSININTVAGSGTVSLEVITSHGSATTDISYLPPVISVLSVNSSPCEGGLSLVISGTNLCDASEVLFGAISVPVISASATTVSVIIPGGFGTVPVSVISPSGTSNALPLSYQLPAITGVSAAQFSCTGGEVVQVLGVSLCDPISVLINGEEQVVTFSSPTLVEFITPPAILGGIARLKVVSNGITSNQLVLDYTGYGCTNPSAVNFDPLAVCDHGYCVVIDDPNNCPGDINQDGSINTGDLTFLLGVFGSVCP